MKKRIDISINEIFISMAIIVIILCFGAVFLKNTSPNLRNILLVLSTVISVTLLIYKFLISKKFNKGLPMECSRNPFGFIEVHIGEKCNSQFELGYLMLDIIDIAKKENRNILFDTWLVKEDNIREYFGDSAEIKEPRAIQKLSNMANINKYERHKSNTTNKKDNKCYRYIIHVDKIRVKENSKLKKFINRKNNRK